MNKKLEVYEMRDELSKFFSLDAAEALAEFLESYRQNDMFDAHSIQSEWTEYASIEEAAKHYTNSPTEGTLRWFRNQTIVLVFNDEESNGVLVMRF